MNIRVDKRARMSSYCHPNVLITMLCICGCIYQIYTVTKLYTEFGVIYQFQIQRPEEISVPDLSYCISLEGALNLTQFTKENQPLITQIIKEKPIYEDLLNESLIHLNSGKFLLNQFMQPLAWNTPLTKWFGYLHKFDDVITVKFSKNPNLTINDHFHPNFEKKMSIKSLEICYTLKFKENLTYDYNKLMVLAAHSGMLIGITINFDLTSASLTKELLFHMKGTQPRGPLHSYILEGMESPHNGYDLTYQRHITKLLPSPYITRCVNYSETGFESRDHAFDDCAYKLSVNKTKSLCCNSLINFDQDLIEFNENFTALADFQLYHHETERKILQTCEKRFPYPDCLMVKIVPKQKKAFLIETGVNYSFFIYAPWDSDFVTTTFPAMDILDYLIYSGSAIGFWFGLSLIQFLANSRKALTNLIVNMSKKDEHVINIVENLNDNINIRPVSRRQRVTLTPVEAI